MPSSAVTGSRLSIVLAAKQFFKRQADDRVESRAAEWTGEPVEERRYNVWSHSESRQESACCLDRPREGVEKEENQTYSCGRAHSC